MRILIITQIFLPEMGALANRLYPIVRQLVSAGHEVTVATGMPNYPAGKVFPEYRGKLFVREQRDGYTILRTAYLTVPRNKSKILQLASYLSFIPAVFYSGWRAGEMDVVFVSSPPPFLLLSAVRLARLRGAKLVVDVRDLWSDELATYGAMSEDSLPIRVVRAIERCGYENADLVTCTTESLIETIAGRGAEGKKTFFLPNGVDLELFHPRPVDDETVGQYGFGDRFVVMYSGLFGIKHGLEVFLEAAKLLRDQKDIVFFMIGNGARRDFIEKKLKDEKIENVIIGESRPIEEIPSVLARAGLCFAAVQAGPYPKKLISVKIFEYFGCEKPVVGSLEGESARVIDESGGGIVVPPGDAKATAEAILELYNNPAQRTAMGKAGRLYVEKQYSRSEWAARFESRLSTLCEEGRKVPAKIIDAQMLPENSSMPPSA